MSGYTFRVFEDGNLVASFGGERAARRFASRLVDGGAGVLLVASRDGEVAWTDTCDGLTSSVSS